MEAVQVLGGRYRLVERLGIGGMSVVWRAHDEVLGRQVAVKVLAGRFAADSKSREQIRAEAKAVARLSHPHITNVYDYGESETSEGERVPYVVMELLTGRTLAQRLARGPMPWRAALRVGAEVAAGLAAAHARGLVHRDVKPANVMLTSSGAKVVDFGIAAVAGEKIELGPGATLLGTPAYLAPERLEGGPVQAATDVYALGLLLYRMLCGNLPWRAETATQMIAAHCYIEPDPLPPIEGLPPAIADVVSRCLQKAPDDRPDSREIARTLSAAAGIRVPLGESSSQSDADPEEVDDVDRDDVDTLDGELAEAADAVEETPVPAPVSPGPVVDGTDHPPAKRVRAAFAALLASPVLGPEPPPVDADAVTSAVPSPATANAEGTDAIGRRRARAVTMGASGAGLIAAAVLLGMCGSPSDLGRASEAAGPLPGRADAVPCAVRYQTVSDTGSSFQVDLTIRNTAARAVGGWTVAFTFPGDQFVQDGLAGGWAQTGNIVTVRDAGVNADLPSEASTTVHFTGNYHDVNPLPTEFTLNGLRCAYTVIGASGETKTGMPPTAGDLAQPAVNTGGNARAGGAGGGAPVAGVPGGSNTGAEPVVPPPAIPPPAPPPVQPPPRSRPPKTPNPSRTPRSPRPSRSRSPKPQVIDAAVNATVATIPDGTGSEWPVLFI